MSTDHPLQDTLNALRDEIPELLSIDLVSIDSGFSIGGATTGAEIESSVAAASFAEVVKVNHNALELLGFGGNTSEDILITNRDLSAVIQLLGPEYFLLVLVGRRGNLGLTRAIMQRSRARLVELVRLP